MINWKVRIKNKTFWISIIPMILLLIQQVAAIFGYSLDLSDLGNSILAVVETVFGILAIIGIVVDPTTKGIKDSQNALTYEEPK